LRGHGAKKGGVVYEVGGSVRGGGVLLGARGGGGKGEKNIFKFKYQLQTLISHRIT